MQFATPRQAQDIEPGPSINLAKILLLARPLLAQKERFPFLLSILTRIQLLHKYWAYFYRIAPLQFNFQLDTCYDEARLTVLAREQGLTYPQYLALDRITFEFEDHPQTVGDILKKVRKEHLPSLPNLPREDEAPGAPVADMTGPQAAGRRDSQQHSSEHANLSKILDDASKAHVELPKTIKQLLACRMENIICLTKLRSCALWIFDNSASYVVWKERLLEEDIYAWKAFNNGEWTAEQLEAMAKFRHAEWNAGAPPAEEK